MWNVYEDNTEYRSLKLLKVVETLTEASNLVKVILPKDLVFDQDVVGVGHNAFDGRINAIYIVDESTQDIDVPLAVCEGTRYYFASQDTLESPSDATSNEYYMAGSEENLKHIFLRRFVTSSGCLLGPEESEYKRRVILSRMYEVYKIPPKFDQWKLVTDKAVLSRRYAQEIRRIKYEKNLDIPNLHRYI